MKKKLLSLVALASLMLVGCNDDKKSEQTPSSETPISESAKPSTEKPSTSKPTTEAPTFNLTTPEGRHAYYMHYQSDETAKITIQGKVVHYVTYSGSKTCNVAIQEGIYGYWLNNVAKDSVEIGGSYTFTGKGAAKDYPAVNAKEATVTAVAAIETTTLKLGAAENNFEDSRNAYIELDGTAEVTAIEDNVYSFLVGGETYTFSYNASVTQAADIATKLANLKVGCTITKLAGSWYKEKQVSICSPSEIEYTLPAATSVAVTAANNVTTVQAKTTLQLFAVVNPEGASQEVVWSSENEAIATVDATGLVTGVADGTVKIFATAKNTEVKGEITLTVTAAPTTPVNSIEITAAGAAKGAKVGETLALSTTVLPSTAAQNVTWSSSDEEIATVDATGVVSFVGDGDVTITATATDDSGVSDTIALSTVVEGLVTVSSIIEEVKALDDNKATASHTFRAKVVSKNNGSFLLADATGSFITYSYDDFPYAVGDTVLITGALCQYKLAVQLKGSNVTSVVLSKKDAGAPTTATVKTAAELTAMSNGNVNPYVGGQYIEVANTKLSKSGTYTNLSVGGVTVKTNLKAAEGSTLPDVEIYGTLRFWTQYANKSKVLYIWADYFQANPSVNPTTITIAGDDSVNLSASTKFTVTATSTAAGQYENVSHEVTWSVANGDAAVTEPLATIAADGTLTAGAVAGSVIVTATSVAVPTVKATKTVTIAGAAPTYSLVTDVANIAAGDKISIAYDGGAGKQFAMGAPAGTSSNPYRDKIDVSIANDSYVAVDGMAQLEVVTGATDGTFAFKDVATNKYLAYTKGAKAKRNNILEESGTVTAQSSWKVVIDADGMKITNAEATDRVLQYNTSNPRFACYTGSQVNASIYELATAA